MLEAPAASCSPIPRSARPISKAGTEHADAALLGTSPAIFIGLTVILVGGAAILTGRAVADDWKPAWQVVASASASLWPIDS